MSFIKKHEEADKKKKANKKIESELPFFITIVTLLATSGFGPYTIFMKIKDLDLLPISVYNKTKMVAERVFMSFKDEITVNCIRPATVCGISPRMRFDITVNLLTLHALKNKEITVFGGNQVRPNIHIKDMVRLYDFFLKKNISSGFYNAGFENLLSSVFQLDSYALSFHLLH